MLRRVAGLLLLVLSALPLYRLLAARHTGLAGDATVAAVDLQVALLWSGFLIALIPAIVAGRLLDPASLARVVARADERLRAPGTTMFAAGVGVAAALIALVATFGAFDAVPALIDAHAQLTQARYFAAGESGGPADLPGGFWYVANMVRTDAGWFAQYPPGHAALLAIGFALGAPWLVGVVAFAATAALAVPVFERLLPERRGLARAAALGVMVSPFLLSHAAGYMNHATAAALMMLAMYGALRARDGSAGFAAVAGGATAALAAVRPLAGVVMAVLAALAWWFAGPPRRFVTRGALAVVGGLPLLGALLWFNREAFGGMLASGYGVGWGPAHGLGFHADPWGNSYGLVEAILYTSADLNALNLNLFETPIPVVSLAALWLLLRRESLGANERLIAVWALLPVVANAFYWHHGWFMGPRMLAEWSPAWIVFACVAVASLVQRVPDVYLLSGSAAPRAAALGLVGAGIAGMLLLAPQRLASHGSASAAVPDAPDVPPNAIVFVHGSWESRLAGRLAYRGLRLDQIETALRENPTCLVQLHLDAAAPGMPPGEAPGLRPLDLDASGTAYLPRVEITPSSRMRHDTTRALPQSCAMQAAADRFGAIDLTEYVWRGSLPGIEDERPLYVRDLGPALNAQLLARYPDRAPYLFAILREGDAPQLVPYDEGMGALWAAPSL